MRFKARREWFPPEDAVLNSAARRLQAAYRTPFAALISEHIHLSLEILYVIQDGPLCNSLGNSIAAVFTAGKCMENVGRRYYCLSIAPRKFALSLV